MNCMAWWAWHEKRYGLVGMSWHMVWPDGHNMVKGMVWRGIAWYMAWPGNAWHDIWYGLACMAWYMAWPGLHGMVYGMALWAW